MLLMPVHCILGVISVWGFWLKQLQRSGYKYKHFSVFTHFFTQCFTSD